MEVILEDTEEENKPQQLMSQLNNHRFLSHSW